MATPFAPALIAGVERLTAWADLLDEINVFPVADGDTGRNLVLSLAPLRQIAALGREKTVRELLLSARGNSGNIAARFLSGLLTADSEATLGGAVREGRDRAWQAVADPHPGTILTVFDALAEVLADEASAAALPYAGLLKHLAGAVLATTEKIPRLKAAGVVDAGALGAYLFFAGFFGTLAGEESDPQPITERFAGRLSLSPAFREESGKGYCIDTVLELAGQGENAARDLTALGESCVVIKDGATLKVHFHAEDREKAKGEVGALGRVVRWAADDLDAQVRAFTKRSGGQTLHVVTDAAGSVSRETAAALGITLLDSYLTIGGRALPETHLDPGELYGAMRRGEKVSTSQASLYERHESYRSLRDRYPRLLYLCVGSVYTGNHAAATKWQEDEDPEGRFTIVDTGAASGRLGLSAIATARLAAATEDAAAVVSFARAAVEECQEFIFLDQLRYLAAGGRLSKAGGFAGDLFRMKPVISPFPDGAKKVGIVRDREGQLRFALEKLALGLGVEGQGSLILLEYTDNAPWVTEEVRPEIARRHPGAEILLEPMSLTSGAHMGPGTWAVAFLK